MFHPCLYHLVHPLDQQSMMSFGDNEDIYKQYPSLLAPVCYAAPNRALTSTGSHGIQAEDNQGADM